MEAWEKTGETFNDNELPDELVVLLIAVHETRQQ
ncbi:cytochrome P450 [cyanobacterium endosymbiont of Rhopalodia gibberula]|nr:cytochrome P450 [cyanobacterium endosymbiont of Rhopalodia gibberula]